MKYFLILILVVFVIGFSVASHTFADSNRHTEAKLEWEKHNFRITNGTGTAKIILTDQDMNNSSHYAETVNVFVYSDSFPEGIMLKLYETEKNSGIFERIFSFSDTRSAPSILYVQEGDTATATYTDTTLPSIHTFSELHIMETTLIGHSVPPLERVETSSLQIEDIHGNIFSKDISSYQQIRLGSDLANNYNNTQNFVYLIQIQDEYKQTVSLSWIQGIMIPFQTLSSFQSWIPEK